MSPTCSTLFSHKIHTLAALNRSTFDATGLLIFVLCAVQLIHLNLWNICIYRTAEHRPTGSSYRRLHNLIRKYLFRIWMNEKPAIFLDTALLFREWCDWNASIHRNSTFTVLSSRTTLLHLRFCVWMFKCVNVCALGRAEYVNIWLQPDLKKKKYFEWEYVNKLCADVAYPLFVCLVFN